MAGGNAPRGAWGFVVCDGSLPAASAHTLHRIARLRMTSANDSYWLTIRMHGGAYQWVQIAPGQVGPPGPEGPAGEEGAEVAGKRETFGPVALTTTLTTNIVAPAAAGASAVGYTATASYIVLTHVRIVNKTAGAATFSLWKGATGANAAGTEVIGTALSVAANSAFDWYGNLRLEGSGGFLVGGASANTTLTFQAEGEIGLV